VGLAYAVQATALSESTIPHPGSLTIRHSPPAVIRTGIVMPLALTAMTDTTRERSRRWMGFKSNTRAAVTAGLADEERAPAQRQPYCTQHSPVPGGKRRAVGCGASSEVGVVASHACSDRAAWDRLKVKVYC
jgi:hypothetical protein